MQHFEFIEGNVLEIMDRPYYFLAHGVNCINRMGSGVAKVIYKKNFEVKRSYHEYCEHFKSPRDILGHCQPVNLSSTPYPQIVFNCFSQLTIGDADHDSIVKSLSMACAFVESSADHDVEPILHLPLIGYALGGLGEKVFDAYEEVAVKYPNVKLVVVYRKDDVPQSVIEKYSTQ